MTTMRKGVLGEASTGREVRILVLVADGHADDAVARAMGVGESTIRTRMVILRRKLGARNRTNAVHLAHLQGVFTPTDGAGARGDASSARAALPRAPLGAGRPTQPTTSRRL